MSTNYDLNPVRDNLGNIPPVLYKYRTFGGYWQAMVEKGEVFFSNPIEFNDPFDCFFIPDSKAFQMTEEQLKEYAKTKTEHYFTQASPSKKREMEERFIARLKRFKENPSEATPDVMEIQYRNGVCPLSGIPDSIPMWAYYADNHQGLCIGLKTEYIAKHQEDLTKVEKGLMQLFKVEYNDEVPVNNIDVDSPNLTKEEMEEIQKTFYRKSTSWSHEDEYRLVYWKYANQAYWFSVDAIEEVIVGLWAELHNINRLRKSLKRVDSKAKLKKAERVHGKYHIKLIDIP